MNFFLESTNLQSVKSALLISSSSADGEEFLDSSIGEIERITRGLTSLCFIPYAAVSISFDDYFRKFASRLAHLNIEITSLHNSNTLSTAEAICVGGGNTFALLDRLQKSGALESIRHRVAGGTPYIGWSAGSNIASPTICTTNDMPIIEPRGFQALELIPFQINPHYTELQIEGHAGESREARIIEYIAMNPTRYVVGLREGSMLRIEDNHIELLGQHPMRLFKYGHPTLELTTHDNLDFLIQNR